MSEVELYPGRVSRLGLGTIPHGDISRYTGLELLQRIIDNKYPAPPISFQLSFDLTEVSEGRAVFRGMPNERYLNPLGGCMAAGPRRSDSALACGVQTLLDKGEVYTTAEFKVNLTRPITRRPARWCARAGWCTRAAHWRFRKQR